MSVFYVVCFVGISVRSHFFDLLELFLLFIACFPRSVASPLRPEVYFESLGFS